MTTHDDTNIKTGLKCCENADCDACPYHYYGTITECLAAIASDTIAYINQLEQRLASVGKTCPEWISVDDRLPEYFKAVLIYCPTDKNVYEVYLETHGMWRFFDYSAGKVIDEPVTHWMPLPEPPNEG